MGYQQEYEAKVIDFARVLGEHKFPTYEELKTGLIRLIDEGKISREDAARLIPELRESEDEKIRKVLVSIVKWLGYDSSFFIENSVTKSKVLAYLEHQKEQKEELVYRLNGLMQDYIKEGKNDEEKKHRFKCYHLFWDALEDTSYFKQKEQKPPIDVDPCDASCDAYYQRGLNKGYELGLEAGRKEQKPAEKHDYSGLNDSERAIHRGFLVAGIDNVSVGIIKDTAKECIANFPWPTKWSKEDENTINELCNIIVSNSKNGYLGGYYAGDLVQKLKSLRPQQKAEWSEEDSKRYISIGTTLETSVVLSKEDYDANMSWLRNLVYSQKYSRPKPQEEIYQAAKHDLAIKFMNYLDENRPEGNIGLSNAECEDIDKAFKENDWAKIIRYIKKCLPS